MDFDAENRNLYLPPYLSAEERELVHRELKSIGSGRDANYFLGRHHESSGDERMRQGDGWQGFQLFAFSAGKLHTVKGLVLSNSCDVDPDNPRDLPTRVIFSPLVKLATYRDLLEGSSVPKRTIDDKIRSIKSQQTTNIFYLPSNGPLGEDYIARFDEIHSMPLSVHNQHADKAKLFTLSDTGFYMLTLKLSIHFCRLQEQVSRNPPHP